MTLEESNGPIEFGNSQRGQLSREHRDLADRANGTSRREVRALPVTIGDRAMGSWTTKQDVWPETWEQPCRMHYIANVLDTPPYPAQIPGKRAYTR
jgi:hypothetical protein